MITHSNLDLQATMVRLTYNVLGTDQSSLPKITTLLAPVRLSPVPPASVETKNMNTSGELLNLSIMGMPKHHEKQGSSLK